ncbi:MAG TPA: TetR/AcrR family transcriptional regulator [Myxococcota bacterium]|nr:TetR/AcrR family transcriptional regulator [Myxococcota bacterium]
MSLTPLNPDEKLPSDLSPSEARRARQREEARRAILDATEALLLEADGEAFGVRALAARCGYTAPTIYHYFGDKDGLIDALLEERFARLLAEVQRVEQGDDPLENLRAMLRAYLRFAEANPTFYRVILAGRGGPDRSPPSVEATVELMMRPWEDLEAAGRLRHAGTEGASQSLWALIHGLTALRVARPEHEWVPDLTEIAIEAMLRGLVRDEDEEPARARNVRNAGERS